MTCGTSRKWMEFESIGGAETQRIVRAKRQLTLQESHAQVSHSKSCHFLSLSEVYASHADDPALI